jgi:hypothetical protein
MKKGVLMEQKQMTYKNMNYHYKQNGDLKILMSFM